MHEHGGEKDANEQDGQPQAESCRQVGLPGVLERCPARRSVCQLRDAGNVQCRGALAHMLGGRCILPVTLPCTCCLAQFQLRIPKLGLCVVHGCEERHLGDILEFLAHLAGNEREHVQQHGAVAPQSVQLPPQERRGADDAHEEQTQVAAIQQEIMLLFLVQVCLQREVFVLLQQRQHDGQRVVHCCSDVRLSRSHLTPGKVSDALELGDEPLHRLGNSECHVHCPALISAVHHCHPLTIQHRLAVCVVQQSVVSRQLLLLLGQLLLVIREHISDQPAGQQLEVFLALQQKMLHVGRP